MYRYLIILLLPIILFAQSQRVYYENFDDRDIDQPSKGTITIYLGNWIVAVLGQDYSLDSTGRGGTGYCMSDVGRDDTDPHLCWFNPDLQSDEVYVSFWQKFAYANLQSYPNLKQFYPHWDGTNSYVHLAMAASDGSSHYYSAHGSSGQILGQSTYFNTPGVCNGQWHHFEFWIKFSTAQFRFWYDGVLTADKNYADGSWGNTIYYLTAYKEDASGGASGTDYFTRQLDDFEVWNGMPSGELPEDIIPPISFIELTQPNVDSLRIQQLSKSADCANDTIWYNGQSTQFKVLTGTTLLDTTFWYGGWWGYRSVYWSGEDASGNWSGKVFADSLTIIEPNPPGEAKTKLIMYGIEKE